MGKSPREFSRIYTVLWIGGRKSTLRSMGRFLRKNDRQA